MLPFDPSATIDPVVQFYALGVLTGLCAGAGIGWLIRSFFIAAREAGAAPTRRSRIDARDAIGGA